MSCYLHFLRFKKRRKKEILFKSCKLKFYLNNTQYIDLFFMIIINIYMEKILIINKITMYYSSCEP